MATTLAGKPLVQASWALLRRDPSMIVLLVVGGFSASIAFALVALPATVVLGVPAEGRGGPADVIAYAIALFVSTLVSTFFLGAVVAAAMERADGGDPTFSSALAAAWERRRELVAWAALATAVGVALRLLERFGIAGAIARLLAGVSWAVATWFAIPVIMAEGTMPIETVKRSSQILTSRFGSNVRATVRLGLIFLGLYLALFAVGFVGIMVSFDGAQRRSTITLAIGILIIIAAVVCGFVVSAVGSAIGAYLRTVLYRYASGLPTPGIDPRLLPAMLPVAPAYDGADRFGTPVPQLYDPSTGRRGAHLATGVTVTPDPLYSTPAPPPAAPPAAPFSTPAAPPAPTPPAAPAAPPVFVEPVEAPRGQFEHDVAGAHIPGIPPAPTPAPPSSPPPAAGGRHAAQPSPPTAGGGVFLPEDPGR